MKTLCQGCQTPIDPSAESCPTCLRHRSRNEIMRSFADIKKEELRRKRIPYFVLAGLALAALAAWLGPIAYRQVAPIVQNQASALIKRAEDALARAESPESYSQQATPTTPIATPAPTQFQPAALPKSPAAQAPPAPAQEPPHWAISGQVYDLLSLRPAAGAQLRFTAPDGMARRAAADAQGRYEISLPILAEGGYVLRVQRAGASADYIEEGYTPFTQLDAGRRKSAVRDALAAKILHVPITVDETGALVYNVALLPRRLP